jgi:formylglycine-generating enzyme
MNRRACLFGLVLAGAACGTYSESARTSVPDAASDASADDGGRQDDSATPTTDAGADGDAAPSGPCPAGMLVVNAVTGARYCIDATEVTQSAYKAFLTTDGGAPSNQPSECAFNASFIPPAPGCAQSTYTPDDTPNRPVTCVDWCDAHAYCAWAGKRLCGRIGGGALTSGELFSATTDQWFAACSKHGSQSFPYGNSYDATKCNGDRDGGTIANVGAFPGCTGGVGSGLFDMVGNVAELEDQCGRNDASTPDQDGCAARGGAFGDSTASGTVAYLRCDNLSGYMYIKRGSGSPSVGFRCCSDL